MSIFNAKDDRHWERLFGRIATEANRVLKKYAAERLAWSKRPAVKLLEVQRVCPGGRHAWYHSNVGPVRKPIYG